MKKKLLISLSIILAVAVVAVFILGIVFLTVPPKLGERATVGVKWTEAYSDKDTEDYMNFIVENKISEIYYKDLSFDEYAVKLLTMAKERNIKVYAYWEDDNFAVNPSSFNTRYANYKSFNKSNADIAYSGIHLNVNPTKISTWQSNRRAALASYIKDFVFYVCDQCNADNIPIDMEIMSNLDHKRSSPNELNAESDEVTDNGETKTASEWIIERADRVFVKVQSNDVRTMIENSKSEFEFAKLNDKPIFITLETADLSDITTNNDDNEGISYYGMSRRRLASDINDFIKSVSQESGVLVNDISTLSKMKVN